jgi:PiT family inorganic phosphate transporter
LYEKKGCVTNVQLLNVIVIVTLAFEFTNGWHDAASSIATIVSTRVLRPLWAVAWAAFWNFFAAFVFGTAVAKTMGSGLVDLKMVNQTILLAGLLGAIVWNYTTIRLGLPASSSHALMGGYGGAAVAAVGFRAILIHGWIKPIIFIFLGPLIGMAAGLVVTVITSWFVYRQPPRRVDKWFRRLQLVSAGAFSLGHGTNDAQKGMGIITAALVSGGALSSYAVPFWVIICCHLAIAGGTMAGGWRVVRTMGQRITKLNPFSGFAAETAAAMTLIGTAAGGIPVSTTHVITGAIVGVGASRRLTAVRWGVTGRIMWAWVLTIPGAGLMGALFYFALRLWLH